MGLHRLTSTFLSKIVGSALSSSTLHLYTLWLASYLVGPSLLGSHTKTMMPSMKAEKTNAAIGMAAQIRFPLTPALASHAMFLTS